MVVHGEAGGTVGVEEGERTRVQMGVDKEAEAGKQGAASLQFRSVRASGGDAPISHFVLARPNRKLE